MKIKRLCIFLSLLLIFNTGYTSFAYADEGVEHNLEVDLCEAISSDHFHTVNQQSVYKDVLTDHWAYDAIIFLKDKGIVSGDPNGFFRPNDCITNAEAAKMFSSMTKMSHSTNVEYIYADVGAYEWYSDYALMTDEYFYDRYNEYGYKIFRADAGLTREEMFYSIIRILGESVGEIKKEELNYTDIDNMDDNFVPYAKKAVDIGLVSGYEDGTIRPKASITRAEFSKLMHQIYIRKEKKLMVHFENNTAYVTSAYPEIGEALKFSLNRHGGNSIFDFKSITEMVKSNEAYEAVKLWDFDTDFLSPYIVSAVYNPDGTLPYSKDFTGGNHCYNNLGSGATPTGYTELVNFFVDGVPVINYDGEAREIEIKYRNYVQATNTKKEDGSGRCVLAEDVCVRYDGGVWKVSNTVTALEDVIIERYYGFQFPGKGMFYNVSYGNQNGFDAENPVNVESRSNGECNTIIFSGNKYKMRMTFDFESASSILNLQNKEYKAFTESYGKTYYNIINADNVLNLKSGESFTVSGSYEFFCR